MSGPYFENTGTNIRFWADRVNWQYPDERQAIPAVGHQFADRLPYAHIDGGYRRLPVSVRLPSSMENSTKISTLSPEQQTGVPRKPSENATPQRKSRWQECVDAAVKVQVSGFWLHWAALVCEFFGSLLVFLEARRFDSQFQGIYHGWFNKLQPGYGGWWYDSGGVGFLLLALGIVLTGSALALDHRSRRSGRK